MAGYDVIVVGARAAGAPTAMLLARAGHRVLLVDKATFPSDTISTLLIHRPGVAALKRWGLLDAVVASGAPPIERYAFDFGPVTLAGTPHEVDGASFSIGPRRTVLDEILVRAAADAGAEVREDFAVDEVIVDDGMVSGIRGHTRGGAPVTERARVVVGADGKRSLVAKAVGAETYNEVPQLEAGYYAFWSGLPTHGFFETHIRAEHGRGFAAIPTNDGLTCVVGGWPYREFETNRKDYEGNYLAMFDLVPEFAERMQSATRESRIFASGDLRGVFRKPYGPGWALVGDAGYHKDPITAFGITDAFRDAELGSAAISAALGGREEALAEWQRARDEQSLPVYGMTCDFAKIEPPPPEMIALFGAIAGNQDAMDEFVSVMGGVISPAEFFAPENLGRLMGAPA